MHTSSSWTLAYNNILNVIGRYTVYAGSVNLGGGREGALPKGGPSLETVGGAVVELASITARVCPLWILRWTVS